MRLRIASINDLPIRESDRRYHWAAWPPPDITFVSDLGL